jgi:hypothetical protein
MTDTTLTPADYALAEDMFREAIANNATGEENLADITNVVISQLAYLLQIR